MKNGNHFSQYITCLSRDSENNQCYGYRIWRYQCKRYGYGVRHYIVNVIFYVCEGESPRKRVWAINIIIV